MEFETCVYVMVDGEEIEVPISVEFNASYTPAYVSGLPENCYEAESDLEITAITTDAEWNAGYGVTGEMLSAAIEAAMDDIEEKAWKEYFDLCEDQKYQSRDA